MFQNMSKRSWMKLQWMKQITLFFTVQALRRKSGVYIFKVRQRDDEWNYKWGKDTEGENPKNNISACEIHYSNINLKNVCIR